MDVGGFLARREAGTKTQIKEFCSALLKELRTDETREIFGDHTCLYAVGSAGRMEMSPHSDFDLFVVRRPTTPITRIDEVRLQSSLVRVHRDLGLPEPSNDAVYLGIHSLANFVERLGEPRDDTENTFTARMLLLLESTPIHGQSVYDEVIDKAIDAYWTNIEYHEDDYRPFCLLNDIVRYWKVLLLNYEWKTADKLRKLERERSSRDMSDDEFRAKKLSLESDKWRRSCKLRFSRCLTCYGTIAWLLAEESRTRKVTRDSFRSVIKLPPLARLRSAAEIRGDKIAVTLFSKLEVNYARYLDTHSETRPVLLQKLQEREFRKHQLDEAERFGNDFFAFIEHIGRGNQLYRYLVI